MEWSSILFLPPAALVRAHLGQRVPLPIINRHCISNETHNHWAWPCLRVWNQNLIIKNRKFFASKIKLILICTELGLSFYLPCPWQFPSWTVLVCAVLEWAGSVGVACWGELPQFAELAVPHGSWWLPVGTKSASSMLYLHNQCQGSKYINALYQIWSNTVDVWCLQADNFDCYNNMGLKMLPTICREEYKITL